MAPVVHQKRLLFVTGKGGVGKTTVAAALATELSRRRRVLAVEIGGISSLGRLLGLAETRYTPQEVSETLHVARLTPPECLREYGLMKLRFKRVYSLVFENAFVKSLVNMLPGMEELLLMGKLGYLVQGMERKPESVPYDILVVDAPPTGQGANLFNLPSTILGTVTSGPMARETAQLQRILTDESTTGILLVTNPEELAVDEALEMARDVLEAGRLPACALLVNKRIPPPEGRQTRQVLRTFVQARRGRGDLSEPYPAFSAALQMAGLQEAQEREVLRLQRSSQMPVLDLPLLPLDGSGAADWRRLSRALKPLFERECG